LPLVVGPDGRRLAKRHGDTRLAFYRQQGVKPGRVLALLAKWCGVEMGDSIQADDLFGNFHLGRMPTTPTIFSASDDAWLRAG
jgi:glutamyl-tRNA synthetase